MSNSQPSIASLQPNVLADKRRVTLEMVVKGLPPMINAFFTMPDMEDAPAPPDPDQPSPYPNIELSILNSRRQPVAALYIVEHKEEESALTLHLRAPDLEEQYIARAEMIYQDQTIDVVEIPFTLQAGR